jgi:hypothetical protein
MVDFNLDATEGEWFQFFGSHIDLNTGEIVYEDPMSDARVQIRNWRPFINERIEKRKKSFEHVLNSKTRTMERISYYPDLSPAEIKTEKEDTYDYSITGIENFKDSKTGEVIICTRENKIKLMNNPVFDRFFARCQQILDSSGIKVKEDTEKN